MNILYVWDADYPWDIRVEKICSSLQKKGNVVHIAARNLKKRPECEVLQDLHIHRLKPWRNEKLNYALSFPAFFSPVWGNFLNKIVTSNKIDIILVRDLPMAIAGIWCGRKNKIPVVFDMAEDYVSMVKDIWKRRKFQGFNLIVRNPYLAGIVEKYVFKRMDAILVVVEEAKSVVLKNGGTPDKLTIVSNTPSINLFSPIAIDTIDPILNELRNHTTAIYIGGIQMGRGIQTVLDGIPSLVEHIPDFLFAIIGSGYAKQDLEKMTTGKNLGKFVRWVGWVDHKNIFQYIRASKFGVIPHLTSDHVNTTIPNKIFDFMGCGLPVIASDAIPIKRILSEEKCGRTFKSGDTNDFVATFLDMFKSNYEYGKNGKDAVINKYNWEMDESRLLKTIENVK